MPTYRDRKSIQHFMVPSAVTDEKLSPGSVTVLGPGGDWDPGYVMDMITIQNRGSAEATDANIYVLDSVGILDSSEVGGYIVIPAGKSRTFGPRSSVLVYLDSDASEDVPWDCDGIALMDQPNEGRAGGAMGDYQLGGDQAGVGRLFFVVDEEPNGAALHTFVCRRPFIVGQNAGVIPDIQLYSETPRTSAGGSYLLSVSKHPQGDANNAVQLLDAGADFDLEGLSAETPNGRTIVASAEARMFAVGDVLAAYVVSDDADLTSGDLLVEVPYELL